MKRLLGFFFVVLYFTALLRPVMPLAEYLLNQEYIAEVLCINKGKPMLHCNGKCYLKQQYKEAEQESESSNTEVEIRLSEYPIGFITKAEIPQQFPVKTTFQLNKVSNYTFTSFNEIFHPPQLS